jgi:hypothetical protein
MRSAHKTLALSVAALLTLGTAAMAIEPPPPTTTQDANAPVLPEMDPSGFTFFGFDIEGAGNTPDAVKSFIAGLTPEQQRNVDVGCSNVLSDPSLATNTSVVQFCHNAMS